MEGTEDKTKTNSENDKKSKDGPSKMERGLNIIGNFFVVVLLPLGMLCLYTMLKDSYEMKIDAMKERNVVSQERIGALQDQIKDLESKQPPKIKELLESQEWIYSYKEKKFTQAINVLEEKKELIESRLEVIQTTLKLSSTLNILRKFQQATTKEEWEYAMKEKNKLFEKFPDPIDRAYTDYLIKMYLAEESGLTIREVAECMKSVIEKYISKGVQESFAIFSSLQLLKDNIECIDQEITAREPGLIAKTPPQEWFDKKRIERSQSGEHKKTWSEDYLKLVISVGLEVGGGMGKQVNHMQTLP